MPARSCSPSAVACLNRASFRHTKRGSAASSNSEWGSKPSLRAREKRSSAWADDDASAASLHHVGQAASIANSLNPNLRRRLLSWSAPSFKSGVLLWFAWRPHTIEGFYYLRNRDRMGFGTVPDFVE